MSSRSVTTMLSTDFTAPDQVLLFVLAIIFVAFWIGLKLLHIVALIYG